MHIVGASARSPCFPLLQKAACRAHKKPWCAAKCPAALMLEGELRQTLKLVNLCCTPLFTGSRLPCIFAELPQPAAFDRQFQAPS